MSAVLAGQSVHLGRAIAGAPAPFFLAYRCSIRSYYDGEPQTSHEDLIDADTDANRLRERVNKHYALPQIIHFERNKKLEIPPFALKSERIHGSGGGCDYAAWLEIRQAPTVTTEECPDCNGKGRTVPHGPTCERCRGGGTV